MKYLLLFLVLLTGCEPKPENEVTDFVFQLPFQMTAHDTVSIGDTLWLTADFSDQLREFNSGNTYPVTPQNFELMTRLGLFELTKPSEGLAAQPSATSYFKFVNKIGGVASGGATFSSLNYVYTQSRYKLKVGLIPQRRGVFCTNFLNGWNSRGRDEPGADLSYLVPGRTADGGKRYATLNFYFYVNEGRTNFYLFKQHCLAISVDINPAVSNINGEQEASFTFVVK